MLVRFGYVAMSVNLKNASPSKTMTVKQFEKIPDQEAGIRKLQRIAQENLTNTLRHLKYNKFEKIHFYRFSSRLIPLADHELTEGWDYYTPLKKQLTEIGEFVSTNDMRVGFHPDHYTLINSKKESIFKNSVEIIRRHVELLKLMNLSTKYRNVLHVGGKTDGKEIAMERFIERFPLVPEELRESLILENDDKIFTAEETLHISETLNVPMVLDLHHDYCNPSNKPVIEMWPRILKTWEKTSFPPKIHISSPRNKSNIRAHADFVSLDDFVPFLQEIKSYTTKLDIMIEAKKKDDALFDIMDKIVEVKGIEKIDESSIQIV